MRLRIQFAKEEPVRYISHLDLARTFERAIRRAKLPIAMSEGFNPHVKVAYASALSVGITSSGEFVDIELRENMAADDAVARLRAQMPNGLTLGQFTVIEGPAAALMAIVNMADYTFAVPMEQAKDEVWVRNQMQTLLAAHTLPIVRHTPKGRREIDARPLIETIDLLHLAADRAVFRARTHITNAGAIKPSEVVQILKEYAHIPLIVEDALINREGLYVYRDGKLASPLTVLR